MASRVDQKIKVREGGKKAREINEEKRKNHKARNQQAEKTRNTIEKSEKQQKPEGRYGRKRSPPFPPLGTCSKSVTQQEATSTGTYY